VRCPKAERSEARLRDTAELPHVMCSRFLIPGRAEWLATNPGATGAAFPSNARLPAAHPTPDGFGHGVLGKRHRPPAPLRHGCCCGRVIGSLRTFGVGAVRLAANPWRGDGTVSGYHRKGTPRTPVTVPKRHQVSLGREGRPGGAAGRHSGVRPAPPPRQPRPYRSLRVFP